MGVSLEARWGRLDMRASVLDVLNRLEAPEPRRAIAPSRVLLQRSEWGI